MRSKWSLVAFVGVALLVGACGSGGAGSPAPTGGSTGTATSQPTTTAGSGGSGADAGSLNACSLLSGADIQGITGWAVGDGLLQDSDGQTDCEWNGGPDDNDAVGLTISNFDSVIWDAGSGAGNSTPVSGIGDAAFKGWPHPGDLSIKFKSYEVDVAIIDFSQQPDVVDQETLRLANLVLPKL